MVKVFECSRIFAHTFFEIRMWMNKAKTKSTATIRFIESSEKDLVYHKKSMRHTPFKHDDGGWWEREDGFGETAAGFEQSLLPSFERQGKKFMVIIKTHERIEAEAITREVPLNVDPSIFVGTKPTAVIIDGVNIPVKTWRMVYTVVLQRCIQDPVYHERLMGLRGRLSGQQRVYISASPDNMTRPFEICEGMYGEVHYGSQTLMHILTERILKPINYDFNGIKIMLK